jgi:DNA-binding MarR family transcriptional regulator
MTPPARRAQSVASETMQTKQKREHRTAAAVPLEERLSYRCSLIAARITRFLVPMLDEQYGLTVITWRVMAVIGRYAPLSAKEIAAHTSTDAFFVFRAVEQLVSRGYVVRNVDSRDRRKSSLQLSATGLAAHQRIEAVLNSVEAHVLSQLDRIEREALSAVLTHLNDSCAQLLQGGKTWRDFAA